MICAQGIQETQHFRNIGAGGGGRTLIPSEGCGILSPVRLPVPPLRPIARKPLPVYRGRRVPKAQPHGMNPGLGYPNKAVSINLAPANVRREGAGFDLCCGAVSIQLRPFNDGWPRRGKWTTSSPEFGSREYVRVFLVRPGTLLGKSTKRQHQQRKCSGLAADHGCPTPPYRVPSP